VTDLPPSKLVDGRVYNSILVICNRFSKLVFYVPVNKTVDTPSLAEVLYYTVILKYGAPKSFVTDYRTVFTSKYWGDITYYFNIKRRFSTAFHA